MTSLHDFSAADLAGTEVKLDRFRDQVALVVNTASQCGFTPQYAGLETLHRDLAERGFTVLAFPCNQFGRQEPGDSAAIAAFCREIYDISFPVFARIEVNGPAAHPLYVWLKSEARGFLGTRSIKWNFTKFLIDRDGKVVRRFGPLTRPQALRGAVEALLRTP